MRLTEIDEWHPGMLHALEEAHRERWTPSDELSLGLLQRVHFLFRVAMVRAENPDPGAFEFTRPGEKVAPKVPAWKRAMSQFMGG
jgi:hypothetical protein